MRQSPENRKNTVVQSYDSQWSTLNENSLNIEPLPESIWSRLSSIDSLAKDSLSTLVIDEEQSTSKQIDGIPEFEIDQTENNIQINSDSNSNSKQQQLQNQGINRTQFVSTKQLSDPILERLIAGYQIENEKLMKKVKQYENEIKQIHSQHQQQQENISRECSRLRNIIESKSGEIVFEESNNLVRKSAQLKHDLQNESSINSDNQMDNMNEISSSAVKSIEVANINLSLSSITQNDNIYTSKETQLSEALKAAKSTIIQQNQVIDSQARRILELEEINRNLSSHGNENETSKTCSNETSPANSSISSMGIVNHRDLPRMTSRRRMKLPFTIEGMLSADIESISNPSSHRSLEGATSYFSPIDPERGQSNELLNKQLSPSSDDDYEFDVNNDDIDRLVSMTVDSDTSFNQEETNDYSHKIENKRKVSSFNKFSKEYEDYLIACEEFINQELLDQTSITQVPDNLMNFKQVNKFATVQTTRKEYIEASQEFIVETFDRHFKFGTTGPLLSDEELTCQKVLLECVQGDKEIVTDFKPYVDEASKSDCRVDDDDVMSSEDEYYYSDYEESELI